jgi:PKD repeat protein
MDSTTYLWEFGDGNSSYDSIPNHTFQNPSGSDTTYTTIMTAESKFGCLSYDTAEITVHSYINASFTLDTIEGCSPLMIDPSGKSYPGISTYTWYFEGVDTLSGPALSNPAAQKYVNRTGTTDTLDIKFLVENTGGCRDSMTRQVIIHPEVNADFAPMDTVGCNPVTVGYRNQSTYRGTPDKAGLSYYWDFDDGNTSTAEDPVHKFTNPSFNDTTYNVNLEVVSPRGCRHDTTGSVEVYSYLKAAFSASNVKGCSPLEVSVTNNSVGNIDYFWFWDDNSLDTLNPDSTISASSFTKTYVNDNLDTVQTKWLTLIVANSQGCTDTMQRKITIYPEVTADFGTTPDPAIGCNPFMVSFSNNSVYTGTSSNTNLSYSWDFDDGGSSSDFEPDHTFTNSLPADTTFNVELAVESNNGCTDTTYGSVTVRDYINALFSVDNPVGCAPYTINIDEYSAGGITGYEWDWEGDGTVDNTTSTGTFTHTYQNTSDTVAVYQLTLIVSNDDGCEDTLTRDIKVYPDVEPQFTMTTDEGCHPVQVDFTNNSTPSGTLTYTWDFGDGGTSNQDEPSHTFYNFSNTDSTSFKVELVAESDYYCADTTSQRVYVHYNPKAKMDVNKTESCPPLNISADNESTGGDTYTWNYGDGDSDTYNNKTSVSHSYDNTDSTVADFDLQLMAETNYGCADSTQLRLSVYPRVTADFAYDSAGCHPFHVQFDNQSENADYYYWDFKDGVTSNLEDPVNRFENNTQSNKTYDVFLRASSEFNCKDSVTKPVTTYPSPNTAFAVTPTLQVFPNSTVKLDNNTNTGPWDYTWHFGDGEKSTVKQPGEYTYDDYGEYTIMLEAESAHCYDSVSHNVIIIAPEPIAEFTTDPVEGCQPLTVQFSDNSQYGDDYFWDFDDGDTSSAQNPQHTFTESGTFYVKQTVSGEGGDDFAYKTIKVFKKPLADFEVEPKLVMLPDEKVAFYNLSKFEDMWSWDFGDGRTANKENPKHLYRDTGRYDIRLEVESYEGCRDTLLKEDVVQVVGKGNIQFPDAFTPNKSGPTGGRWQEGQELGKLNDIFHPIGEGVIEYKLEIFNKWGEKIFESNDFHVGWDGYYQNELMPQDVYIWKAEGKFANGKTFERMGDVTLIR